MPKRLTRNRGRKEYNHLSAKKDGHIIVIKGVSHENGVLRNNIESIPFYHLKN